MHQPWLICERPRVERLPELCDNGFVDVPPVRVDLEQVE